MKRLLTKCHDVIDPEHTMTGAELVKEGAGAVALFAMGYVCVVLAFCL